MPFFSNISTFKLLGSYYRLTMQGGATSGTFELLDEHQAHVVSGTWRADAVERGVMDLRWSKTGAEVPQFALVGYVTDLLPPTEH